MKSTVAVAAAIFAVCFALLAWNSAPGVGFHDSGEFALAAACAGLPHPPSAPTWTICAAAFVRIFGFVAEPARGTNLFSALNGALLCAAGSALAMMWTRRLLPGAPRWVPPACGAVPPLVLFHSGGFLEQSLLTEQYTQMTLLAGTALVLLSKLLDDGARRLRLAFAAGLVAGLAVGNHLSQVALAIPLAIAIGTAALGAAPTPRARIAAGARLALACAAGGFCGLLVFAWLPLRSRANPILDWGDPETAERFWLAITRSQWGSRPVSEAPPGFGAEWLMTYDPLGQLGVPAFILAVAGIAAFARRGHAAFAALAAAAAYALVYALGLFLAHLRQEGMGISYVRQYGVADWHLPLYFLAAIAAGIGAAGLLVRLRPRMSAAVACAVLAVLAIGAAGSLRSQSLRGWKAPEEYVAAVLAPVPPDAWLLCSTDNLSLTLAYWHYGRVSKEPQGRLLAIKRGDFEAHVRKAEERPGGWDRDAVEGWLRRSIDDRAGQPLALPEPVLRAGLGERPLFMNASTDLQSAEAKYLLPCGYLVEVMDRTVPDDEVRSADLAWRRDHGAAFRLPQEGTRHHRLEREAWANLHLMRAVYFDARDLTDLAIESYEASLAWDGNSAESWNALGLLHESEGSLADAASCYEKIIADFPPTRDARMNLGILHAKVGRFDDAERLLAEEIDLFPDNGTAAENLERVRANRLKEARRSP